MTEIRMLSWRIYIATRKVRAGLPDDLSKQVLAHLGRIGLHVLSVFI